MALRRQREGVEGGRNAGGVALVEEEKEEEEDDDEGEKERGGWRGGCHVEGAQRGVATARGSGGRRGCANVGEVENGDEGRKCKKAPGASLNTGAAAQALSFCFSYVAASLARFFEDGRAVRTRCITSVTRALGRAAVSYLADREKGTRETPSAARRVGRPSRRGCSETSIRDV